MSKLDMEKHPSALNPVTAIFNIIIAILGAIIGMQLIVSLGITANTSIIGALIAMLIARIPLGYFSKKYRSIHEQNLVQTAISAATFGAANSLLIPIGIPFVMGTPELILPMLLGAALAMFADATILYKLFDSKIFPAKGTWPPGVATAEALFAGDQGGKRAGLLGIGTALGLIGSHLGISMSAFGVAFIGNIWALTMFGVGLLFRGYSKQLLGIDINTLYVPHGFMIGAGIVALIQVILIVRKKQSTVKEHERELFEGLTRSEKDISQAFGYGFLAYLAIALVIALTAGIITKMSFGMLIIYLIFAAFAAFVHEIIVGISAMHSGWFPAFAVALITLIIGMLIGFPPVALALMVGYSAATGPAFADMGYDLKTGYIIRGKGSNLEYEKDGRKQQFITALLGFGVAIVAVLVAYKGYFAANLVPPVDRVYVATIKAGTSAEIARNLFLWSIPGAILQFVGGSSRQMGILFATGLLILNPKAGWAVLAGILIRVIVLKVKGESAEAPMSVLAAGFIAGDALYSFFNSIFKMGVKK